MTSISAVVAASAATVAPVVATPSAAAIASAAATSIPTGQAKSQANNQTNNQAMPLPSVQPYYSPVQYPGVALPAAATAQAAVPGTTLHLIPYYNSNMSATTQFQQQQQQQQLQQFQLFLQKQHQQQQAVPLWFQTIREISHFTTMFQNSLFPNNLGEMGQWSQAIYQLTQKIELLRNILLSTLQEYNSGLKKNEEFITSGLGNVGPNPTPQNNWVSGGDAPCGAGAAPAAAAAFVSSSEAIESFKSPTMTTTTMPVPILSTSTAVSTTAVSTAATTNALLAAPTAGTQPPAVTALKAATTISTIKTMPPRWADYQDLPSEDLKASANEKKPQPREVPIIIGFNGPSSNGGSTQNGLKNHNNYNGANGGNNNNNNNGLNHKPVARIPYHHWKNEYKCSCAFDHPFVACFQYRSQMCRKYWGKPCNNSSCLFAHHERELRSFCQKCETVHNLATTNCPSKSLRCERCCGTHLTTSCTSCPFCAKSHYAKECRQPFCYWCGLTFDEKNRHSLSTCPNRLCAQCNGMGHSHNECPEIKARDAKGLKWICKYCGNHHQWSFECHRVDRLKCGFCNEHGHTFFHCPELPFVSMNAKRERLAKVVSLHLANHGNENPEEEQNPSAATATATATATAIAAANGVETNGAETSTAAAAAGVLNDHVQTNDEVYDDAPESLEADQNDGEAGEGEAFDPEQLEDLNEDDQEGQETLAALTNLRVTTQGY